MRVFRGRGLTRRWALRRVSPISLDSPQDSRRKGTRRHSDPKTSRGGFFHDLEYKRDKQRELKGDPLSSTFSSTLVATPSPIPDGSRVKFRFFSLLPTSNNKARTHKRLNTKISFIRIPSAPTPLLYPYICDSEFNCGKQSRNYGRFGGVDLYYLSTLIEWSSLKTLDSFRTKEGSSTMSRYQSLFPVLPPLPLSPTVTGR